MNTVDVARMFVTWDDTQREVLDIITKKKPVDPDLKLTVEYRLWQGWFLTDDLFFIKSAFYAYPDSEELQEHLADLTRVFIQDVERECPQIANAIRRGMKTEEEEDPKLLIDDRFRERVARGISRVV